MVANQSSTGLVLGSLGKIGGAIGLILFLLGAVTLTRADWVMSVFVTIPILLALWSFVCTVDCVRFGSVRRWSHMLLAWMLTWAYGNGLDSIEPLGFDADFFSQPVLYQVSTEYGLSVIGYFCIYLVIIEAIGIVILPGNHKRPFLDQCFEFPPAYRSIEEWESE